MSGWCRCGSGQETVEGPLVLARAQTRPDGAATITAQEYDALLDQFKVDWANAGGMG